MELVEQKLDEYIQRIKHRENTIKTSVFDIGRELLYIKQERLYLGRYGTFKECIDDNFSFSIRQAEKFMSVANKFKEQSQLSSIGITKLYLLTQVPEESFDEVLEEVKENPKISVETVKKKVKLMMSAVGNSKEPESKHLTLKRQFNIIRSQFEDHITMKQDLKKSLNNWIEQAASIDDSDIQNLIGEASALVLDL